MTTMVNPSLLAAIEEQTRAEQSANTANEDRYQQILSGFGSMGALTGAILGKGTAEQRKLLEELIRDQPQLVAGLRDMLLQQMGGNREDILGSLGDTREALMAGYAGRESDILGGNRELQAALQKQYGERGDRLLGDLSKREQELLAGYGESRESALDRLKGMGKQARRDISRQFGEAADRASSGLQARGLGGSTVLGSVLKGIGRESSDAQRRLSEQLRREAMGVELGTSQASLAARERMGSQALQAGMGLSSEQLAALERGGQTQSGLAAELSGQRLANQGSTDFAIANLKNALMSGEAGALERLGLGEIQLDAGLRQALINLIGQSTEAKTNLMGQNARDQLAFMERRNDLAPDRESLGTLAQSVGAAGAGPPTTMPPKKYAMFCVDGDSWVRTPNGRMLLMDTRVGDNVMGTDRQYHRVIATDIGAPEISRTNDYVRVTTSRGVIVLTADHMVNGVHAAALEPDTLIASPCYSDAVRVLLVDPTVAPVVSGDLLLENHGDYIVNNLPVGSMMARCLVE